MPKLPIRNRKKDGRYRNRNSYLKQMNKMDTLHNLILMNFREYHPVMPAQFQRENRLEAELNKTARQIRQLHYCLVREQKMDYQEAWEIVPDQFFLPQEG